MKFGFEGGQRPLHQLPKRGFKNPFSLTFQVSRVTVKAKAAVEATDGSVRRVYYNKLGFRTLLKAEWFGKKGGRLLPKAAWQPPKQRDKVDRLPAPTKPLPFLPEEKGAAVAPAAS